MQDQYNILELLSYSALPTGAIDACRSRSASPDEIYQKQSDDLLPLPTYTHPSLPPPYSYFPPTSWPTPYAHQPSYNYLTEK